MDHGEGSPQEGARTPNKDGSSRTRLPSTDHHHLDNNSATELEHESAEQLVPDIFQISRQPLQHQSHHQTDVDVHDSIPHLSEAETAQAMMSIEKRKERDKNQLLWVFQIPARTCIGELMPFHSVFCDHFFSRRTERNDAARITARSLCGSRCCR